MYGSAFFTDEIGPEFIDKVASVNNYWNDVNEKVKDNYFLVGD